MSDIRPCAYPACQDHTGNPRLTDQTICTSCRRRYRRLLDDIVLDYVHLATTMPQPTIPEDQTNIRTPKTSFGHPREWASDQLRKIMNTLDGAEDGLRDHQHHTPPAPPGTAREAFIVNRSWTYLTAHFDALCTYPGAEATADNIHEIHSTIRRNLGLGQIHKRLPTPCPDCGLITLTRTLDRATTDQITCDNCHRIIREDHYGLYARMVLDTLLDTLAVTTP